jgi:hypothetical protein
MHKQKRFQRLLPITLFLAGVAVSYLLFRNHLSPPDGLMNLQQVDNHPLYVLHYQGDYAFDEFLKEGLRGNAVSQLSDHSDWACTCFAAMGVSGDFQFGRNFDWNDDPTLLLFTDPPDAYASVSMVDISYLGFGKGEPSEENLRNLSEAPFLPFDGMNEYGVVIGMMAVPHAEGGNDPSKITIDSLHAIRLVLDYAKNIDEAIALLDNYNVDFGDGPPLHYLIADRGGNSVVIEYLDNEMIVIRNGGTWQVATNFILAGTTLEQARSSCDRYRTTYDALNRNGGGMIGDGSMLLLNDVSQPSTIWSVVYNMSSGDIQIVMGRAYGQPLAFKLDMLPIQ